MAQATCLFVGAAAPPDDGDNPAREARKRRLVKSVQHDFQRMVEFVTKTSSKKRGAPVGARQFHHPVSISKVLLNEQILAASKTEVCRHFPRDSKEHDNLQRVEWTPYTSQHEVREEVCSFLQDSPTENLILFLAGHGTQQRRQYRPVRESLLIPTPTPGSVEYYTDAQLTEDIADNLPEDKKLYIIIHACHSGGMLNLWEIDTSERWIALFASAEADILAKWSANDEDQTYIDTFCECAKRGETLAEIAGRITRTYADVHDRVRPAFVTSNPDIALDTFL